MKTFWITVLTIALIGIVLIGIGFGMGSVGDFYIDANGNYHGNEEGSMREETLNEFKNINIDLGSAQLNIVKGDSYKIVIENERNNEIEYSVENGALNLRQERILMIFGFRFKYPEVTLYLPETAEFNDVNIHLASGSANVEKLAANNWRTKVSSGKVTLNNVSSKQAELNVSSGKLTLNGFSADNAECKLSSGTFEMADSRLQNVKAKVSSGKVLMKNIDIDSLDCTVTSGNVSVGGKLNKNAKLKVSSGKMLLDINGSAKDYNRVLTATSGGCYVDGQKQEGVFDVGTEKSIEAKVTSGKVEINFDR